MKDVISVKKYNKYMVDGVVPDHILSNAEMQNR